MGASNNAQGQNAGARQQINQQSTQALQRLMMYLSQNPNPLQGAPNPTAPPGSVGTGTPMGGGAPGPGSTMNPAQTQQLMTALQGMSGAQRPPGQ